MKIAYFDLGFSKEDYSLNPRKYGGGAVLARYAKEDPSIDFHVFAPQEAFENVGENERKDRCHAIDRSICNAFRGGAALNGDFWNQFDLILHGHTCFSLGRGTCTKPLVHWSGFDGSAGNPGNDFILLYDPSFRPQFGEKAKYVRIGKPVPDTFVPSVKEDFNFTCCRHDDHMATINVAKQCLQYGIKGIFAGPIHNGYPLLDYIDNKTTFYLGEIDEVTKLDYCRRARLFSILYAWNPPFSQSLIEAQGQGTPIYVNRRGPFLKTYLREGINGFSEEYESFGGLREQTLEDAFRMAKDVDQRECWKAAREYDTSVMIRTFKTAFEEIVAEWRQTHPIL